MSEKTAGEVYKKNIGGVVFVSTQSGRGSGVVVGDNEVVTNCHVVDDGNPITVRLPGDGVSASPKQSRARVIAASGLDLCLLKTEGLSAPAVELGESVSMDIGDPVYAIGNPKGIYGTLSSGIVSQSHPLSDDGKQAGCEIQMTASITYGSSGGGLFDREGRLVGITYRSPEHGESLHRALPVELLAYLRQRAAIEARLREDLSRALESKSPRPDDFLTLASSAIDNIQDKTKLADTWSSVGEAAARAGNMNFAGAALARLAALSESASAEKERDEALAGAANVCSCMGEIDRALKFAEEIGDEGKKHIAIGGIAEEQARMEEPRGDHARAREIYRQLPAFEQVEDLLLLGVMARALAEMRDSENALDIAQKIDEISDIDFVAAIAATAAALYRQGTVVGSKALFEFALKHAPEGDSRALFWSVIGLAAAECGDKDTAESVLKHSKWKEYFFQKEYRHQILYYGHMSEREALLGNIPKAREWMRRIPVLEDGSLARALVRMAIAMSQAPR